MTGDGRKLEAFVRAERDQQRGQEKQITCHTRLPSFPSRGKIIRTSHIDSALKERHVIGFAFRFWPSIVSKDGDSVAPLSSKLSLGTVNGKNIDDIDLSEKALNPVSSMTADISAIDASDVEDKSIPSSASKGVRLRANIQLVALCFSVFLLGWNDGPTGPLLPRFQSFYHVRICLTYH